MNIIGIVFHWSAGKYQQTFEDYHYNITWNPKTKKAEIVKTCNSDFDVLPHTWHRNTGRIGIALACCYNGNTNNLGKYPPRPEQVELACALAGEKAFQYKIVEQEIKTHGEWAKIDGYGLNSGDPQTRWDLWVPNWQDKGKNLTVVMRDKTLYYKKQEVLKHNV